MLNLKRLDREKIFSQLLFICLIFILASQYYLIFDSVHARKIFYTTGYIVMILALLFRRYLQKPLRNKSPTIAVLILALTFIIWALIFRHDGAFLSVYISYETAGKILLMLAILLFICSNFKAASHPLLLDTLLIAGGVLTNLYAIFQHSFLSFSRIEFSFDRATMAAYIITSLDILMLHAVLNRHGWKRYLLFALTISLSFSVIIFSGTRAAILTYPLLCLFLIFTHREVNKSHLIKLMACLFILFMLVLFFFRQALEQRASAFVEDIAAFQSSDSQTSVGARLAMLEAGLRAGSMKLLGQAADSRGAVIADMAKNNTLLLGADEFSGVHMHNELIENFSLRGIIGVITLLAVYASLLWCAWKNRNCALFVITLSLIIYGLSDVIFFSREGVLTYAISILTAITLANNRILSSG